MPKKGDISEYRIWSQMIQRCNNPNNKRYKNYGARGINVCPEWLVFKNFLKDMGKRPEGLTLDRINNDGNYEPSNCKWSTYKEQNNNKQDKSPSIITISLMRLRHTEGHSLRAVGRMFDMDYKTVKRYIS